MKTKGFYRKNMNKEPTNKNFLAFRPTSFSLLGPCSAKMGAVAWPKIHPNALENFGSNLSAQAQKFGIFAKKLSLRIRSP